MSEINCLRCRDVIKTSVTTAHIFDCRATDLGLSMFALTTTILLHYIRLTAFFQDNLGKPASER